MYEITWMGVKADSMLHPTDPGRVPSAPTL